LSVVLFALSVFCNRAAFIFLDISLQNCYCLIDSYSFDA
jgi:hypothetical protein